MTKEEIIEKLHIFDNRFDFIKSKFDKWEDTTTEAFKKQSQDFETEISLIARRTEERLETLERRHLNLKRLSFTFFVFFMILLASNTLSVFVIKLAFEN